MNVCWLLRQKVRAFNLTNPSNQTPLVPHFALALLCLNRGEKTKLRAKICGHYFCHTILFQIQSIDNQLRKPLLTEQLRQLHIN